MDEQISRSPAAPRLAGAGGFVVTTTIRAGYEESRRAAALSHSLGCAYVPRGRRSLNDLCRQSKVEGAVVVSRERVVLSYAGREFFFHPGLAKLRIREIMAGKTDQMVQAMDLRAGDRVLDCTLGLAADALVAGCVVGDGGRVIGLEAVPVVAMLVRCGLEQHRFAHGAQAGGRAAQHSRWVHGSIVSAGRRVEVQVADHREYLSASESDSFDVVYFDPMFRVPRYASSAMEPLRLLAEKAALDPGTVAEAVRVARRRVVLKERRDSPEFKRLGFQQVAGGRHSPVAYGVIEKEAGRGGAEW